MRIHSISVKNYRPFATLEEIRLGPLATIVGQNDVGKSNILRALKLFLETKPKIEEQDIHDKAAPNADVVIEVTFTAFPEKVKLEEDIETTLQEEMLVDSAGNLRIRKTYPRNALAKPNITLITHDFQDDVFSKLTNLKEKELNERCTSIGIDAPKSGRGITNKSKREALQNKAKTANVPLGVTELPLSTTSDLWKSVEILLPELELFESDTRLGVGETTFQSQFRPIVKAAVEDPNVTATKNTFQGAIGAALQKEVDMIFQHLRRHTDVFTGLTAKPIFSWDKAVTFDIWGKDLHGVDNSLELRGSGMRRLLMVAFFQYMAEKGKEKGGNTIFAVEEPENCLHPGLQRELVASFRQLADEGYQVIVTSHSPVFAGASPIEDLALVVRTGGVASTMQTPGLDLSDVAAQLGVEPADQITGYNACIFVEGPDDIIFWKSVASKLKDGGRLSANFDDKNVGFVIAGGDNLKHWVDMRAMCRLSRRFALVLDSDRKSANHNIPQRKLNWKNKCEADGGSCFILRKREAENYLHKDALLRSGRSLVPYDDFIDMKAIYGPNVCKVVTDMTCDEILEMDRYQKDAVEHHELKEISEALLALAGV